MDCPFNFAPPPVEVVVVLDDAVADADAASTVKISTSQSSNSCLLPGRSWRIEAAGVVVIVVLRRTLSGR